MKPKDNMKPKSKSVTGKQIMTQAQMERKRENAKRRRLELNAMNAEKLNTEIENAKQKRPELIKKRDELESQIANKTLQKQLQDTKQELKLLDTYIGSLIKTWRRYLPKTSITIE